MFGNHVGKRLSAFHHGELSETEARRIADHIAACERCRMESEEIRFGVQLASRLSKSEAPASLWAEIEPLIDAELNAEDGGRNHATKPLRWGFFTQPAIASLLLMVAIGSVAAFWIYRRQPDRRADGPSWEVTKLDGRPVIESQPIDDKGRLSLGDLLVTDETSRAQISVGEIGEVQIEPGSRVRMVNAQEDDHRLAMERGKMEAFIWAPPGKFYVNTPSAVAVDLGCSYTLEVNEDGEGLLFVTLGWVAFERDGRESFVPAGAMCATRPKLGPGTPYFEDATKSFISALARFDLGQADASALQTIISEARKEDALTLWHLLTRTNAGDRNLVFDRLAALVPPPREVTREGILGSDRAMLDSWWESLGHGDATWWRMWKLK